MTGSVKHQRWEKSMLTVYSISVPLDCPAQLWHFRVDELKTLSLELEASSLAKSPCADD